MLTIYLKMPAQKLNALVRKPGYADLSKRWVIMKSFIKFQFRYCPFFLMFHSRVLKNKINSIHERILRTIYNDS